ncbi:MAG: hypothetical protein KAJ56_02235 [Candidatus Aenigmarchaeota archaeon]|nr:hypothetical protein [Candidatus Aenigmarchaeota archaeon]
MKRQLLSALLISILVLSISVPAAYATKIIIEDNILIESGEIIDDDIIIIGENIQIRGHIKGDVIALGSTVITDGEIDGDIIVLGQDINLKGKINDDIYALGGHIDIDGPNPDNGIVVGSIIIIDRDTEFKRDVRFAGESINIDGTIGRDVNIAGQTVTVTGIIGGNATIKSESLTIQESSAINGSLNYTSPKEADIKNIDSIKGDIVYTKKIEIKKTYIESIKSSIWSILSLFLIGLLIIYIMPGFIERTEKTIRTRTLKSMLFGFIGLIIIPIVAFIMIFTLIGIPLSLIIFALYIIGLYISTIFVGIALGQKILNRTNKKKAGILSLLIGLIALNLIFILPYIGGLAKIISLVLGFGALIIADFEILKNMGKKTNKKRI